MTIRISLMALSVLALAACSSEPSDAGLPTSFNEAFSVGLTEDRQSAILTFESGAELFENRGVGWHLEEWNGTSWERKWVLAGDAFTIDEWNNGQYDIGDVGVSGAGPDVISLPQTVQTINYRICHGLDDETSPSCGTLPSEPTAPNSTAATSPEPTTTIAIDG